MEIGRVNPSTGVKNRGKITTQKKDFGQSFQHAKKQKSEEQLKKMMKSIRMKGERLAITKSYADVKMYKRYIKEYLENVLEYMYSVNKDISFWQTQYFMTVDTIDQKLEILTGEMVDGEMDTLSIAATVDEISGLLVDIYK